MVAQELATRYGLRKDLLRGGPVCGWSLKSCVRPILWSWVSEGGTPGCTPINVGDGAGAGWGILATNEPLPFHHMCDTVCRWHMCIHYFRTRTSYTYSVSEHRQGLTPSAPPLWYTVLCVLALRNDDVIVVTSESADPWQIVLAVVCVGSYTTINIYM